MYLKGILLLLWPALLGCFCMMGGRTDDAVSASTESLVVIDGVYAGCFDALPGIK